MFFRTASLRFAEPGRVTAIVLDGNSTTFDDFAYARLQIVDLVGKLGPGDRMAIYVLYQGLAIVQDYTGDRDLLLKSITAYRPPALTRVRGWGGSRRASPPKACRHSMTSAMN